MAWCGLVQGVAGVTPGGPKQSPSDLRFGSSLQGVRLRFLRGLEFTAGGKPTAKEKLLGTRTRTSLVGYIFLVQKTSCRQSLEKEDGRSHVYKI